MATEQPVAQTSNEKKIISSGNYLLDTIYLYTRSTQELVYYGNGINPAINTPQYNDDLCINALKYIFDKANENNLFDNENMVELESYLKQELGNDDYKLSENLIIFTSNAYDPTKNKEQLDNIEVVINNFFIAIQQTSFFSPQKVNNEIVKDTDGNPLNNSIIAISSSWKIITEPASENQSKYDFKSFTDKESNIFKTPNEIFEYLTKNAEGEGIDFLKNLKENNDISFEIKNLFNYVILLFSISLGVNWNYNRYEMSREDNAYKLNLQRRNGMLISFLSIFITYFKPLLDVFMTTETYKTENYTNIIKFINQIVYFYNSCVDDTGHINGEQLKSNTTYDIQYKTSKAKSEDNNNRIFKTKNADKSYELLEEYNTKLDDTDFNNPNYTKAINNSNNNRLDYEFLASSKHVSETGKLTELMIPKFDKNASWEPLLTPKHGLSQIEINNILSSLNLNMCKSEFGLFKNTESQFRITGIPLINVNSIRNFLYTKGVGTVFLENTNNFNIFGYFKSLLIDCSVFISKFYILTAIQTHYEFIYFTKIGSFGVHIDKHAVSKVVLNCEKHDSHGKFAILTGFEQPNKTELLDIFLSIQMAHRVMIIFDMQQKKIYYFEPFGIYYPVYDVYGRLVPHMQEWVVSTELYQIFSKLYNTNSIAQIGWKIVLPLYEIKSNVRRTNRNPKNSTKLNYCNTSVFNIARVKMYGLEPADYTMINIIINTTGILQKEKSGKTYDWVIGYCGLITILMTILIKLNCDPKSSPNNEIIPRTVDDIYLWFNQFNSNPLYTYENLFSRFLLRGVAKLTEDIQASKGYLAITPVLYDLNDINIIDRFRTGKGPDTTKLAINKFHMPDSSLILTDTLFNIAGINIKDFTKLNAEQYKPARKKLNTVIFFINNIVSGGKNQNKSLNELELDTELLQQLYAKQSQIYKIQADIDIKKGNKKTKKSANLIAPKILPYGAKPIITKYITGKFSKKDRVHFEREPERDIFKLLNDTNVFNPNPDTPRVLFIDTQST
jgi:hypothetical protein